MEFFEHMDKSTRFPNFNFEQFFNDKKIDFKTHDSDDHKEYAVCCPQCADRGESRNDTKYRLWINSKTGLFYCYNCDWAGPLPRFVQIVEKTDYEKALRILRGDLIDPLEHLHVLLDSGDMGWYEEVIEPQEDVLKEIELPFGFKPIEGPHPYLKKRGIPWKYAKKNDWGFAEVGYCKGRIIVPSFMEDKLVFWQARATQDVDEKGFKKVLNPKGVSARSVLFNYDIAKKFEQIILVEGFVDAVKVGDNAVATNGKKLHPQQVEWLRKTEAKEIIIMWDADSWTDEKLYRRGPMKGKIKHQASILEAADMLKAFFSVKLVRLPSDIDPGKLPRKHSVFKKLVKSAKSL